MKKNYESPEMEIKLIENKDIITTSGDVPNKDITYPESKLPKLF